MSFEQIILKPTGAKIDRCINCHTKLIFRKPTLLEQKMLREQFMRDYDEHIARPEDIYAISDDCECGQGGIIYYNVNLDSLK
jgi:hypothetical protein